MCHPVHECQISSHTYVEVRWVRDPVLLRQRLDALHLVGLLGPRAHRARRPAPAGRQQKLPLTLEQVLHELGLAVHVGTDLARSSCVRGHRGPTRTIIRTRKVLIFQLHVCERVTQTIGFVCRIDQRHLLHITLKAVANLMRSSKAETISGVRSRPPPSPPVEL